MIKKIKFYLYLVAIIFIHQQMDAVNWKTILLGATLAAQLPDSTAHEYSVTNNLDVPVGLEYLMRHDFLDNILQLNKIAVEFNCKTDDTIDEETCSLRSLRYATPDMAPKFSTSIKPHEILKIYTAGYTMSNMKAHELHPDVSSFQYPFCWDCYKENSIGDELDTRTLVKYRTFEINKGDLNSEQDLQFDRHFPQQKEKEQVQEDKDL